MLLFSKRTQAAPVIVDGVFVCILPGIVSVIQLNSLSDMAFAILSFLTFFFDYSISNGFLLPKAFLMSGACIVAITISPNCSWLIAPSIAL